ncbi:unnamed protein product [Closterium sp. NIES-65]|nr:unnamed protein product [Closterium sp. NIES-65]
MPQGPPLLPLRRAVQVAARGMQSAAFQPHRAQRTNGGCGWVRWDVVLYLVRRCKDRPSFLSWMYRWQPPQGCRVPYASVRPQSAQQEGGVCGRLSAPAAVILAALPHLRLPFPALPSRPYAPTPASIPHSPIPLLPACATRRWHLWAIPWGCSSSSPSSASSPASHAPPLSHPTPILPLPRRFPTHSPILIAPSLRNKKVAFVGDSVGLQQFFSFLCLISPTPRTHEPYIESRDSDYKFNWTTGWRGWQGSAYRFPETNTTVVLKWTTSLCHVARKDWANESAGQAAHLDQPDEFLKQHMEEMDVIIMNTGHHWNINKMQEYGWQFHMGLLPIPSDTDKEMEGDFNVPMRTVLPVRSPPYPHFPSPPYPHPLPSHPPQQQDAGVGVALPPAQHTCPPRRAQADGGRLQRAHAHRAALLCPMPSFPPSSPLPPPSNKMQEYGWHFHLHGVPVPPDVHKEMEGDFNVPMRTVLRSTALWTHRQLQAIAEERERMRLVAMREGGRGEGAEREGGEGGVRALPLVLLVTRSPAHFMDGQWNTGGGCDKLQSMLTQEETDRLHFQSRDWNAEAAVEGTAVRLLNITALSALRPEAHLSRWYDKDGKAPGQQDCVHWCLPGVPDTWNELLFWEIVRSGRFPLSGEVQGRGDRDGSSRLVQDM